MKKFANPISQGKVAVWGALLALGIIPVLVAINTVSPLTLWGLILPGCIALVMLFDVPQDTKLYWPAMRNRLVLLLPGVITNLYWGLLHSSASQTIGWMDIVKANVMPFAIGAGLLVAYYWVGNILARSK